MKTEDVARRYPEIARAKGPDDCAEHMVLQARKNGQEQWTNIYAAQLAQFVGYGCEVRALPQPPPVAQAAPTLLGIARAICRSDASGPTCVMDDHPERPSCSDDNCCRFAQARAVLALLPTAMRSIRNEIIEECAKIVDAECERILSAQTPTSDPLSVTDTVNMNLRMMAAILPEISAAIRGLALTRPEQK
ncbi:MAG: hypothetical protein NVS3B5_01590 [Sphingomicrobium sp.]